MNKALTHIQELVAKRRAKQKQKSYKVYPMSDTDMLLLNRLVSLHNFRMPYNDKPYGELFIHWFYQDRYNDTLSRCEIFHLNMLQYFNVMDKVEVIHIRCASSNPKTLAMKKAIDILSCGKATIDFKVVPQKNSWEYDTFKECVNYAVDTDKFVYYTHFKGVSRLEDKTLGINRKYVKDSTDLDILYWCYLMYFGLFNNKPTSNAIGPIRTNNHRLLKVYADNKWTRNIRNSQDFFYRGSFQAFSGSAIKNNLAELGVPLDTTLPVGTHTVELWLSAIFKETEIQSLPATNKSMNTPGYHEWTRRVFPQLAYLFESLYTITDVLHYFGNVIVSMTSWKNRIGNVCPVIKSLLKQDRLPNSIQLNLALTDFPNKEKDLPLDLQKLIHTSKKICINWVSQDTNVFKKIIPTLKKFIGTDYILLSIDDDILYAPTYITQMLCLLGSADAASADVGWVGFKAICHSKIFTKDFWEKLTNDVISCRIDDAYISEYLKLKNAKCIYNPRKEILDLLQDYNPINPNSSFLDGYSQESILHANNAIKKALNS